MTAMHTIESLAVLGELAGQEIAVSDWLPIDQHRIDLFAAATGDNQWIHVDVERSRRESPMGGTIAHGFLTLSMLSVLMERTIAVAGVTMALNYGLNKVRFPAPVPAGSRIRGRFTLLSLIAVDGGAQATWQVQIELEGSDKPACVAESLIRYYR